MLGPQLAMANELIRAHHEFNDVVRCLVQDLFSHEWDVNHKEHEVDKVLRYFPSGTSIG